MTRFTVDTNILIYSIDPTDTAKHALATRCVRALHHQQSNIPLQCVTEFYRAVTRKHLLDAASASSLVQRFLFTLNPISAAPPDVVEAMRIHASGSLSFFDAMLLATAQRCGATLFLSEDGQDGRRFGPTTIRNPFLMSTEELDTVLS